MYKIYCKNVSDIFSKFGDIEEKYENLMVLRGKGKTSHHPLHFPRVSFFPSSLLIFCPQAIPPPLPVTNNKASTSYIPAVS